MNNHFASGLATEAMAAQKSNQFLNEMSDQSEETKSKKSAVPPLLPKAFKFGQVDQKMLMSRLYSTPFKKENSPQQYALEMGGTSVHKPHIKRLDKPPPPPEPIVNIFFKFISQLAPNSNISE